MDCFNTIPQQVYSIKKSDINQVTIEIIVIICNNMNNNKQEKEINDDEYKFGKQVSEGIIETLNLAESNLVNAQRIAKKTSASVVLNQSDGETWATQS